MTRLDAIRERAHAAGADGVLLSALPDIRWAVGFTGSNGALLVLPNAALFITDGRYRTQAEAEVQGAEVVVVERVLDEVIARLPPRERLVRQADVLTIADAALLGEAGVRWIDETGFLAGAVARKTDAEIACIARAQALTDAVFAEVCDLVAVGMTEAEVAAEITYRHLRRGAQRMSFEPIVASGPNSALPHARPTDRAVQHGEVLLLDFGCVVDGYASDMTRTLVLGEASDRLAHVHGVVLEAQQHAIRCARAGMTTAELDAAAREVIEAAGYGPHFSHSLGHGIGLQTHEWPRLSQRTEDVLPPNCAVTIEPGIYLPGAFGVRIEDLVVLEPGGCRVLTQSPRALLVR